MINLSLFRAWFLGAKEFDGRLEKAGLDLFWRVKPSSGKPFSLSTAYQYDTPKEQVKRNHVLARKEVLL